MVVFSLQWDRHIDVTTTQSLTARPTTAVCHYGLFATATMTAETAAMSRAVVSLRTRVQCHIPALITNTFMFVHHFMS